MSKILSEAEWYNANYEFYKIGGVLQITAMLRKYAAYVLSVQQKRQMEAIGFLEFKEHYYHRLLGEMKFMRSHGGDGITEYTTSELYTIYLQQNK